MLQNILLLISDVVLLLFVHYLYFIAILKHETLLLQKRLIYHNYKPVFDILC